MDKIICENCGKQCESKDVIISVANDNRISIRCRDCGKLFGHCHTCSNCGPCGFFEDPDPMPQFKVVAQQIRQGNNTFVGQRQIRNPDRVKKFCMDGKCKCFFDDPEQPFCCRHDGYATCSNYCEQEYSKIVEDFSMQETIEN